MEIREDACVFSDLFLGNVREATAASPLPLSPSVSEAVPPKPSDPGKLFPTKTILQFATDVIALVIVLLSIINPQSPLTTSPSVPSSSKDGLPASPRQASQLSLTSEKEDQSFSLRSMDLCTMSLVSEKTSSKVVVVGNIV
ncbi:F-box protein [Musa troglodytarum]|uniref:F-box protein n=1 Tax=Musa troglodytarum TaxID=320322 RepID=A0A9E7F1M9_9LILI|nr:F-box protein [Musa troglodytarum]